MHIITRTVWLLSLVSLFTDIASEMLYPVMPIYLKSIGFSVLLIGILEGFAEAITGLSKGYFGKLSDYSGKRLPFVQLGYALSAFSKPMMAMFIFPLWIFAARTLDRLGKGIRTGARDALLSDEATPTNKGKVFGFHRGMDTLGAVLGPTLALLYLHYFPADYQSLFFLAFLPGLFSIVLTLLIKEKRVVIISQDKVRFSAFWDYWKVSPIAYRKVVVGLLLFALFNSSDVFLLLRMKEVGLDDSSVIGTYIFYNLVYALFAYPLGIVADKIGLQKTFVGGLGIFALVYLGMAFSDNLFIFGGLFFLYGIYAASTESVAKAWISNLCAKSDVATAMGTYAGFQSICTFFASSLAGLLWFYGGATVTLVTTAVMTGVVILYFTLLLKGNRSEFSNP